MQKHLRKITRLKESTPGQLPQLKEFYTIYKIREGLAGKRSGWKRLHKFAVKKHSALAFPSLQ